MTRPVIDRIVSDLRHSPKTDPHQLRKQEHERNRDLPFRNESWSAGPRRRRNARFPLAFHADECPIYWTCAPALPTQWEGSNAYAMW